MFETWASIIWCLYSGVRFLFSLARRVQSNKISVTNKSQSSLQEQWMHLDIEMNWQRRPTQYICTNRTDLHTIQRTNELLWVRHCGLSRRGKMNIKHQHRFSHITCAHRFASYFLCRLLFFFLLHKIHLLNIVFEAKKWTGIIIVLPLAKDIKYTMKLCSCNEWHQLLFVMFI